MMNRFWGVLLTGWLALTVRCVAEPLYEFGFNIRARMRVDDNRNANLLLYSQFGEYSAAHLALYGENRLSMYFAQKLQNFDKPVDPDEVEQAFIRYDGRGWRFQAGKMWMPFGQGMGERELAKGVLFSVPLWRKNALDIALATNGSRRQQGVFCRFGSRSLGASVAVGEHLALSKTAFRFIRGEDYEPALDTGYGLLVGVDTRQVAGLTLWQLEAIVARRGRMMPDTEFLIVQASVRLPAGLNPVVRAEADRRAGEVRWLVSVQQNMGGGFVLHPQVVFRRADFEQVNMELRASF
ncbi:MAG: hypothetical protein K6U75_06310 [Firmicutes bacterium]|nr:hypothetical protein [Bacillota bacterium]